LFVLPNASAPVTPVSPEPHLGTPPNELRSKAALGPIPVTVGLKLALAWQPEGFLKQPERDRQRARIAAAAAVFAERLSKRGIDVQMLRTIPFVQLRIDASTLEELLASEDVVSIELNGMGHGGLMDSAHIVRSDDAANLLGLTGAGQVIVVIDSGVQSSHPFLAGKVIAEACFSGKDAPATSLCPNGQVTMTGSGAGVNCAVDGCNHGTHVAGIAAGKNGVQTPPAPTLQGIARDASLIAIQVFSRGTGNQCTPYLSSPCGIYADTDLQAAMDYVTFSLVGHYPIAAVNLSLYDHHNYSTRADCDAAKPALRLAIRNVTSFNIAVTGITGNDGYTSGTSSPGCFTGVFEVGATAKNDTVATDFILPQASSSAGYFDFLAPGDGYTAHTGILSSVPGGGYATFYGTSMAAPHVAGAVAIMRQKAPNAPVDYLRHILATNGVAVTDPRNGVTKPRIDVMAALTHTTTDTQAPSAPSSLVLQTVTLNTAKIGWNASTDDDAVESYHVERRSSVADDWQYLGKTTLLELLDSGLSAYTAYQYRVQAFDYWGNASPTATMVVTTMQFTDGTLLVGSTMVKAVHVTELRTAVNAVRASAGLLAATWTNAPLAGQKIRAMDIQELRTQLAPALTAIGVEPPPPYTDPTLGIEVTIVKQIHIDELRRNVN
jgi:subtilisin family serine protease